MLRIYKIMEWRIASDRAAERGIGLDSRACIDESTRRKILEQKEVMRYLLRDKSDIEISEIYRHEAAQAEDNPAVQAALDEQQFFCQPDAVADLAHWSRMPGWTLEEAVALTLGRAPDVVAWDSMQPYTNTSPFAKQYKQVRDLVLRAKELDQLSDPVLPGEFLAWATRSGIDVPVELIQQVEAQGVVVADWRERYDSLKQEFDEYREATNVQVAELRQERDDLRQQLNESHLESNLSVGEVERASLLKILLGMAVAKYEYQVNAIRNPATGENKNSIHADMIKLGLEVDVDTVRKYVKDAEDRYGDAISRSLGLRS